MKYNYKKILMLTLVCAGGFLFINSVNGPGSVSAGSNAVAGAPFNSGFCTNCHASSNAYNTGATTLQLLSAGTPVVGNYVQGWTYTLRINRGKNATHDALAAAGWGFQIVCVRNNAPTYTNVNSWGTLPSNTTSRTLGGRTYVEHTSKLSKSITTLDIPWTGPSGSVGTVTFYLALNNVNGNGGNSGDHPFATSASYTMAGLPVTWVFFNGTEQNNGVMLEWGTSSEVDNGFFTIEKSADGTNFSLLTKVDAKASGEPNNLYSYLDATPLANTSYYRIKQTDLNGDESYFKTITVKKEQRGRCSHYIDNNDVVVNYPALGNRSITVTLYALDGRKTAANSFTTVDGIGRYSLAKPEQPGIYLLCVTEGSKAVYQGKVLVQ